MLTERWNATPMRARPHQPRRTKPARRAVQVDEDGDALDYRDGKEFADYCRLVREALTAEKQSIRAIHERLGDRAIRGWTMDALARVAEYHPGFIDKFALKGDSDYETAARRDPAEPDPDAFELS